MPFSADKVKLAEQPGENLITLYKEKMKTKIVFLSLITFLLLISCKFTGKSEKNDVVAIQVTPNEQANIVIEDGLNVTIPKGAVNTEGTLTVEIVNSSDIPEDNNDFILSIGNTYKIQLPEDKLIKPAVFEFPIDKKDIPNNSNINNLFASYYDESQNSWVYVGGIIDVERNVLIVESDHASFWQLSSWNWEAWAAFLNKFLSTSIIEAYEAVEILTTTCQKSGEFISIDTSNANNILMGCVEKDEIDQPQVRILNPRSFYIEIQYPKNNGAYQDKVLAPGEDILLNINSDGNLPVNITSTMLGKPVNYFLIDMILRMLPGTNQFGFQGETLGCISERLSDASHFLEAANTLYYSTIESDSNTAGLSAAESISDFLRDEDAVQRFVTAADDCNFGPAKTWSVEGVKEIAAATSVIISTTDWISSYFSNGDGASILIDLITPQNSFSELTICGWEIYYDESIWQPEETDWELSNFNHTQLVNSNNPLCQVNCPYGVGTPWSWTIETGNKQFGNQEISYKLFRNESGGLEFVSYKNSNDQYISMGFNGSFLPEKDISSCMQDFDQLIEDSLTR